VTSAPAPLHSRPGTSTPAHRSGHDQFEESTEDIPPLTEEEKKQKLEELKLRVAEKRAVRLGTDPLQGDIGSHQRTGESQDRGARSESE
jgi:hypothetical protein